MRFSYAVSLAFVSLIALPADGGTVTGTFKNGEQVITPKHAEAYVVRDQFDARKSEVEVVLSEIPFDAKAAAAELDPHGFAINSPIKDGNYILLWVKPNGEVSMNATFTEGMIQFGNSTDRGLKAELTVNTAESIEGRVFTPKPVKMRSGETYELDVRFSTTVSHGMKDGKNLPGDGGEPLVALEGLYGAIATKDFAAIKSRLSSRSIDILVEDYKNDQENLESMIGTLEVWLPKKMKFLSGTVNDSHAVLELQGEPYAGTRMIYLASMQKTADGWLFDRAVPAGFVK